MQLRQLNVRGLALNLHLGVSMTEPYFNILYVSIVGYSGFDRPRAFRTTTRSFTSCHEAENLPPLR
jgi:hypothetical protein